MGLNPNQAARLAVTLRNLRESTWPGHVLTQAQLAKALSSEGGLTAATVSSWESTTRPRTPSAARIRAYARFFCTKRSLEGEPHLLPEDQLTPIKVERLRDLESELLKLRDPDERPVRRFLQFDIGPVIVICPDLPDAVRGPLAEGSPALPLTKGALTSTTLRASR